MLLCVISLLCLCKRSQLGKERREREKETRERIACTPFALELNEVLKEEASEARRAKCSVVQTRFNLSKLFTLSFMLS